MPHLKPYLNHFSSVYAICSVAGILLQQIFHIKAATGALMLAAVSFYRLILRQKRTPCAHAPRAILFGKTLHHKRGVGHFVVGGGVRAVVCVCTRHRPSTAMGKSYR